jgi:hypothetical protein
MAKYLAIARGYIDKQGILEPGVSFEYDGKPSEKWMAPVDDAAREAFKKAGFKFTPPPAPPPEEPKGKGKPKGGAGGPPKGTAAGGPKSTGDQDVL